VNTLIYLNPAWEAADGGCLELYSGRRSLTLERTILPSWGTCVIFRSDANSVHGFSRAVAPDRARFAVAAYHYTSIGADSSSGESMTHFWHHHEHWQRTGAPVVMRHARIQLYRSLRFAAKALAYLAYRAQPSLPARDASRTPQEPGQHG